MKHTLSVLVEDESGALSRIAGLFARRGFNIDSLAVGPAEADRQSRLTMVVEGDDQTLQQMTKQLDKLVNVLQVLDLTQRPAVERELMLLKVSAPAETRSAVFDLVQVLTAGGPAGSTESLALYAYINAMRFLDFGYSATLMLAAFLLMLLLSGGAVLLWLVSRPRWAGGQR